MTEHIGSFAKLYAEFAEAEVPAEYPHCCEFHETHQAEAYRGFACR
jgi:hypothetical protein